MRTIRASHVLTSHIFLRFHLACWTSFDLGAQLFLPFLKCYIRVQLGFCWGSGGLKLDDDFCRLTTFARRWFGTVEAEEGVTCWTVNGVNALIPDDGLCTGWIDTPLGPEFFLKRFQSRKLEV